MSVVRVVAVIVLALGWWAFIAEVWVLRVLILTMLGPQG